MINDPSVTSCKSGSNVSTSLATENQPSLICQTEKKNETRTGECLHQGGERKMLRGSLTHTHTHTHTHTQTQNKHTIAARGQFSLLHYPLNRQMRSQPPTDNLPPCPLHRCITSPGSSNCQDWSLPYITPPSNNTCMHSSGQAESEASCW